MATITVRQASRLGSYAKPYVARILGTDPQYKFARSFLEPETKKFGGEWTFEASEDGLYEVCDRNSKGAKRVYWCVLSSGVLQESVSDEVVGEWLAALDAQQGTAISPPVEAVPAAAATWETVEAPHDAHGDNTWNWTIRALGHTFRCEWSPTLHANEDTIRVHVAGPTPITYLQLQIGSPYGDVGIGPSGRHITSDPGKAQEGLAAGLCRIDDHGFVRPSGEILAALCESRPDWKKAKIASDPIANAQAATELAAKKAKERQVDKDTWLPYVRAALTFWHRIQERALADDNTRASFQAAEQQLAFGAEFRQLTGRDFSASDEASYAEIEAL